MKTKRIEQNTTKRLTKWALGVAALLMIPLIAQFPWTRGDFIFAGTVLFGAATIYELATRKMTNKTNRIAVGFAVAVVVLLIWAWAVA